MMYCPENASLYGEFDAKGEGAADWCRRAYQPCADRCQRCDLRKRWGVGIEPAAKKDAGKIPEQRRLF